MKVSDKNKKLMRNLIILIVIIVLIIILAWSYHLVYVQNQVTLKPEVRVTDIVYNYSTTRETFWTPPIYDQFNDEYGSRYSDILRQNIIQNMKGQANSLEEDPYLLEQCLKSTGIFEMNIEGLPCLAEKAKFEYYSNYRGTGPYITGWEYSNGLSLNELNDTNGGSLAIEDCWIFVFNWGARDEHLGHIKIYVVSMEDYTVLYYLTCK